MKARFRKRAGIEGTISHLKQDYRLGRCFLKGWAGDQINVRMAATAYNLQLWIRRVKALYFVQMFSRVLESMRSAISLWKGESLGILADL